MQASILIVSKNRHQELKRTLLILKGLITIADHEVLVFLDGCTDGSKDLIETFNWVTWFFVETSIGASAARHQLYPKAKGVVLIGLDDDAHPLQNDFITKTLAVFQTYPNAGIIAFEEIKGIFKSDEMALQSVDVNKVEYFANEFIGCGFAIRKEVYHATNGFPVWMDIYGEESCLAIEVLSEGYDIVYSNTIKVNHRVDKAARKHSGKNYFRFERQLKNTTGYYMVYYKHPVFKILKLYWHNFKKYAMTDGVCFRLFFKVIFEVVIDTPRILKHRSPINSEVIKKMRQLKPLQY